MTEYDIARLLQSAVFEETLTEESNADDINMDKQNLIKYILH
jgi:hypothetical protein